MRGSRPERGTQEDDHLAVEARGTNRSVAIVTADNQNLPRSHRSAAGIDALVHRGLAAAVTEGADLMQAVCQRQQRRSPLERVALEVGAKTEARDPQAVRGHQIAVDLPYLLGREKLRLIDEKLAHLRQLAGHRENGLSVVRLSITLGAHAGSHLANAEAVIQGTGHDQHPLTNRREVVAALQKRSALAALHRGKVEVEHIAFLLVKHGAQPG